METKLKSRYQDTSVQLWSKPGIVVSHFYGPLDRMQVSKISALYDLEYQKEMSLACLHIVEETARPPAHAERQYFTQFLDSIANGVSIANWFRVDGFLGSALRSAVAAMTLMDKNSIDHKVFKFGNKACEWLICQRHLPYTDLFDEVCVLLEENAVARDGKT